MLKSYSFRIYPTSQQKELFLRQLGSCRFVYNKLLDKRKKAYSRRQESLTFNNGLNEFLNHLKTVFPWLNETYSQCLQMQGRNLDTAFKNFFRDTKHVGYPNFKKKGYSATMQYPQNVKLNVSEHTVYLPKTGLIKCVFHRKFKGVVKTVTLCKTSSDKFFIKVLVENSSELPVGKPVSSVNDVLGIDLGVKDLAICSDGTKYANNKRKQSYERKLERQQRVLSRRMGAKKGQRKSHNYLKQRVKVARLQEKIANCRKDDIEKATTQIADKSQVAVGMENLNVKGMTKNRHMSYSVTDSSMSYFQTRLEQKLKERGKILIKVDRFFPSSQLCSVCLYRNRMLKDLSIREWECPVCHTVHDRDLNAALNLQSEGYSLIRKLPMDGGKVTPVEIASVDDRTFVPKKHTVVETGRVLNTTYSDAPCL